MSYSSMRFVDKLHTDYNPCLTPVWGLLTSYTQATIHVVLRYEVCWQVTHRLQSISYSGMRFVDKLHADYNPCLTPVWGLLTSYTQITIHVLLWYEVCWQDTHRLQSMSYSGMRFVTSYTQTTIHVLLRYEVRWKVTRRLQSMSYSGMRFVDKLHADYNPCLTPVWGLLTSYTQTYNPCLTPVWGLLTSYTQTTIHVLLRYEVCWQVTRRLQSMSYSGMRFVDKLHADYNPCLTPVWGLLTSYTQTTIHILLRYEVYWQDTRRLQSMSYSGMRFVDKLHADYNPSCQVTPCLTPVWGLLTSYTQTTIHVLLRQTIYVLLRYEVRWQVTDRLQSMYNPCYTQTTIHVLLQYEVCCQVTHRLQSMSYYGMRFVDKLHAGYNPCRTPVWGLLTSYTQITIHVLLWYEVCWQVTRRLQSMSYSGMRFVDKLHADYNPCLTPVWGLLTSYTDYNPCLTPVWGLLTSYTQTTIHVLLRYEVRWQVTRRLQSMSYSGMRFVDKLHADYNPCLTPVWGLLTSYTQITIHVLLRYEVCWQVTGRLQFMSYSGMRFVDKLHADYNPYLTPVWGLLTSYTQTTIHVLLRYEVCWQVTRRLQSMSYSGMRFVDKLHRLQSMSYSGMRFVDKLHADYNPCLTLVWGLLTSYNADYNPCLTPVWGLLTSYTHYNLCTRSTILTVTGMRFVDKLHADYNPCLTPVWGLLTSYTQILTTVWGHKLHAGYLLRYEVCWQVTHRLQSMSYSGMRFVDKLHADYNPCLTLVWGLLTSYTQTTIHVLLWYEVCWQVTHRLQSMSYSGMRFVDKLHTDYNPCLTPVEVCWQVTRRLQSMSYSGMRFVDKLQADYNPCLTPVWGLLTSYTQTTIHVLLRYEVCWQVTRRLQSMSYSGMRFVDKLHADYNPCLTPVWGLLTSYTQTTIHVLLRYEVCWQVTRRLQSISYSGMRFIDKLHADYNPCLTLVWGLLTSYMQTTIHLTLVWGLLTSYTQITIHVLLRYEVCWQVTRRLQSMSYSKLHADYNLCLTPVWGSLTSYTQTTIHV